MYCRKIALAAVVCLVAKTNNTSNAAYNTEAMAVTRFSPKPSCRVKMATATAASSERPNDNSSPDRLVHLMKRPPVLQSTAAATTNRSGGNLEESFKTRGQLFSSLALIDFRYLPNTPFHGGMTIETAPSAWA